MKEITLSRVFLLKDKILNINNKILKINCLKNYNKRLSLNLNETRSEDISIPLNKEIKKLFKEIEFKFKQQYKLNIKLMNFWAQVHKKNEATQLHDHLSVNEAVNADRYISGVYYIQVPKKSGNIVFKYIEHKYMDKQYVIIPEENDFLLFPSSLKHEVTKNLSNKERIVISFNYFIQ